MQNLYLRVWGISTKREIYILGHCRGPDFPTFPCDAANHNQNIFYDDQTQTDIFPKITDYLKHNRTKCHTQPQLNNQNLQPSGLLCYKTSEYASCSLYISYRSKFCPPLSAKNPQMHNWIMQEIIHCHQIQTTSIFSCYKYKDYSLPGPQLDNGILQSSGLQISNKNSSPVHQIQITPTFFC